MSILALRRAFPSIVAMLALATAATACGYKGPLYMPPANQAGTRVPPRPATPILALPGATLQSMTPAALPALPDSIPTATSPASVPPR